MYMYMYSSHTESLSESSEDGGEGGGNKDSGKVEEPMEVGRNTPTIHLKGTVHAVTCTHTHSFLILYYGVLISGITCHTSYVILLLLYMHM